MTLTEVDQLMSAGPLALALGLSALAGLVSFASPCVVPLVPGYLSYLAAVVGVEDGVEPSGAVTVARKRPRSFHTFARSVSPGKTTPANRAP